MTQAGGAFAPQIGFRMGADAFGEGEPEGFRIAATPWARFRGLLRLPGYAGVLVLVPCSDIHTWGMDSPIDVAFIDAQGLVIAAFRRVAPRRRRRCRRAVCVMERRSSDEPWFESGMRLTGKGVIA